MPKSRMSSQNSQPNQNPYPPTSPRKNKEALQNLRKDNSCMVLTANKEVALAGIDKDIYIEKCMVSAIFASISVPVAI